MPELETTATNDPQQARTALALRAQDGRLAAAESSRGVDLTDVDLTDIPQYIEHDLGRPFVGAMLLRTSEHCTLLVSSTDDDTRFVELSVSVPGPVTCSLRIV